MKKVNFFNQAGSVQYLVVVLLVIGIGIGTTLVQSGTNFLPFADDGGNSGDFSSTVGGGDSVGVSVGEVQDGGPSGPGDEDRTDTQTAGGATIEGDAGGGFAAQQVDNAKTEYDATQKALSELFNPDGNGLKEGVTIEQLNAAEKAASDAYSKLDNVRDLQDSLSDLGPNPSVSSVVDVAYTHYSGDPEKFGGFIGHQLYSLNVNPNVTVNASMEGASRAGQSQPATIASGVHAANAIGLENLTYGDVKGNYAALALAVEYGFTHQFTDRNVGIGLQALGGFVGGFNEKFNPQLFEFVANLGEKLGHPNPRGEIPGQLSLFNQLAEGREDKKSPQSGRGNAEREAPTAEQTTAQAPDQTKDLDSKYSPAPSKADGTPFADGSTRPAGDGSGWNESLKEGGYLAKDGTPGSYNYGIQTSTPPTAGVTSTVQVDISTTDANGRTTTDTFIGQRNEFVGLPETGSGFVSPSQMESFKEANAGLKK